nr:unnamed protein product [Callosobruchus analis]
MPSTSDKSAFIHSILGISDKQSVVQLKLDTSKSETVQLFCDGCGGQNKNSFQNKNEPFQSLVKRGRGEKKFKLKLSSIENEIAELKKHNIEQLLETQYNSVEMGIKWEDIPELIFFRKIVHGNSTQNEPLDDEEEACDCLELDCGSLHTPTFIVKVALLTEI